MPTSELKCFVCDGDGKAYLLADRDCIEGYKMANKHTCLFCEGTGKILRTDPRYVGARAYLRAVRGQKRRAESKRLRQEADRAKLIENAKAKLTPAEMKALGVKP